MMATESFDQRLRTYLDERTQRVGDPATVERVVATAFEQQARFRHRNLVVAVALAVAAALVVATPLTVHLLNQSQHNTPAPSAHHTPVPPPHATPASAYPSGTGVAAADDPATHQVVLFGGRFQYGNTWIWSGGRWSLAHPAKSPPGRAFASAVYDPDLKEVVLFGGTRIPQPPTTQCCFVGPAINDTWAWDGSTWTEIESGRPGAPVGGFVGMGFDDATNQMVLITFRQANPAPTPNGDLVSNTLATWIWKAGFGWVRQADAHGGAIGPVAYDPISHSLLNVGYQDGSNFLATYRWNGITWTKLGGARGTFSPAVGASLTTSVALDPTSGRLVFLSPSYSQGPTAAAWSWNGQEWTSLPVSHWPGSAEVLVTDSDTGQIWLIGSDVNGPSFAIHVWKLTGSTWTQLDTGGAAS